MPASRNGWRFRRRPGGGVGGEAATKGEISHYIRMLVAQANFIISRV